MELRITHKVAIPVDHTSMFGNIGNVKDVIGNEPPIFVYLPDCGAYYCALQQQSGLKRTLWHVSALDTPFGFPPTPAWDDLGIVQYLVEHRLFDDLFLKTINSYFRTNFCHCEFEGHDCLKHDKKNTGPTATGPVPITIVEDRHIVVN